VFIKDKLNLCDHINNGLVWFMVFNTTFNNIVAVIFIDVRVTVTGSLLCELTVSLLIAITNRSDTGSHNRLDLKQSLVPTHYVCNGYLLQI
jgi:hypothetical protein